MFLKFKENSSKVLKFFLENTFKIEKNLDEILRQFLDIFQKKI